MKFIQEGLTGKMFDKQTFKALLVGGFNPFQKY